MSSHCEDLHAFAGDARSVALKCVWGEVKLAHSWIRWLQMVYVKCIFFRIVAFFVATIVYAPAVAFVLIKT
jgi:hypothetical protein